MRKWITIGATAVLSLVLAGVALADFTQSSNIALTTTHAGKSTGIKADIHSTTSPGEAPKAAKLLVLTFPARTKFNLGSVKACKLSDGQLTAGKSCPSASRIGTGSATASAFPLPQPILAGVKSYAAGSHKMTLVVKATSPFPQTLVIHAIASGAKLTIPVPTPTVAGFQVVLVSLKLNVPARGSGKTELITAGRCRAHSFTVKSHFVYTDGSTADLTSSSPCS
ncbi:MAG TPA: hypothetical protein VMJ65_24225 [Solirubrobacteraceae bacterium]|nr:hypothetical protein [Solirubrobacteraceae bacterium]